MRIIRANGTIQNQCQCGPHQVVYSMSVLLSWGFYSRGRHRQAKGYTSLLRACIPQHILGVDFSRKDVTGCIRRLADHVYKSRKEGST